ncbi:MAG: winged helix-turn-helix transcriptional regulator [Gaiellaceae bacterium]
MSSLVDLFHYRGAVPILAELHRQRGSRFVTLAGTLGLSRESLRQTLAALIAGRLVRRNPGYGHPLRPEYVLTEQGQHVAAACGPLLQALHRRKLEDVCLKKWSMPVVSALAGEPRRFSELREELTGISPRALTLALKDLEAAGLVERRVTDDYPPATVYSLTRRARPLSDLLEPLAA